MSDRGVYRGIFSALPDDPEFQKLSSNARLVLYTARICKQAGPGVIFRYYPELLSAQTGLSRKALHVALKELKEGGWIALEGVVLWVRNGLRYDPYINLNNQKQRLSVIRALKELPKVDIVIKFCDYYELPYPFDTHSIGSPGLAPPSTEEDRIPKKTEEDRIPNAAAAEPPPWPSPAALLVLWDEHAPPGLPRMKTLSPGRARKLTMILRVFPERRFWLEAIAEYPSSQFLLGRRNGQGHENFTADLEWLSQRDKSGTENIVKVHEGRYRDSVRSVLGPKTAANIPAAEGFIRGRSPDTTLEVLS